MRVRTHGVPALLLLLGATLAVIGPWSRDAAAIPGEKHPGTGGVCPGPGTDYFTAVKPARISHAERNRAIRTFEKYFERLTGMKPAGKVRYSVRRDNQSGSITVRMAPASLRTRTAILPGVIYRGQLPAGVKVTKARLATFAAGLESQDPNLPPGKQPRFRPAAFLPK